MEIVTTALLLVIIAEVTYIMAKTQNKGMGKKSGRMIFVDTSVLIDGRIVTVAASGFIGDTLAIPRSVIGELQFLADNADHEKRSRARHGLDVVQELQKMTTVTTTIFADGSKAEEGVDERLLNLAKQYNGVICTIDFNLNKVAQVEGIKVLNINELAQSLRMAYLPGEKLLIQLVTAGQDSHQAVGYLPDGTMVVVEYASKLIGQMAEVEFIRSLQTAAGKMMFAKLVQKQDNNARPQQKPRQPRAPAAPRSSAPTNANNNDRNDRTPKPRGRGGQSQPSRNTKRPPSSADREASLIDLVNNQ
jgi:uncharacterized protein YacL